MRIQPRDEGKSRHPRIEEQRGCERLAATGQLSRGDFPDACCLRRKSKRVVPSANTIPIVKAICEAAFGASESAIFWVSTLTGQLSRGESSDASGLKLSAPKAFRPQDRRAALSQLAFTPKPKIKRAFTPLFRAREISALGFTELPSGHPRHTRLTFERMCRPSQKKTHMTIWASAEIAPRRGLWPESGALGPGSTQRNG